MAIYTKRGDRGETSLFDPHSRQNIRVSKSSARINAIGAIDEVNSWLGIIGGLEEIQRDLFTVGSILAGAKLRFSKTKTKKLEKAIDKLEGELPVLKNFILPGGSQKASFLHYARTLVRKAERQMVALNEEEKVKPKVLIYLNRLSDYFFMLARKANFNTGVKEIIWKKQ